MATTTDINTKVDSAVASMGSGDWATALITLLQVKLMLAAKPDQKHPGGGELTYDRRAIDDLIRKVRKQQHAGAGIQVANIKYVPTTAKP